VVVDTGGAFGARLRDAVAPSATPLVVLADNDHMLDLDDRAAVHDALAAIAAEDGIAAAVVLAIPPAAATPCDLVDLDAGGWEAACERPLRIATHFVHAIHPHLLNSRGSMVFVCPTIGLQGAAGFTALSALAEGQRVLAKSAARQWAADGIRVNVVAPPIGALLDEKLLADPTTVDARRGRVPDRAYDIDSAMRAVLDFLLSPSAQALIGVTIPIDGGQVTAL
jgi:3-oxoacyl-[acyl-carrier protein] reductase